MQLRLILKMPALETILKEKGIKLTEQRKRLLEKALLHHRHFSAEDLYEALRRKRAGISRATVYRTLKLLASHHVLDVHDFDRGYHLYESRVGRHHHDHLVCLKCGRITEFENVHIEGEQEKVARHYRFKMLSHSHKIYGICHHCRTGN